MAKNLTEVDTFTANVTVPEGGDARTASSVEPAFQALANRSLNIKNRIDTLVAARTVQRAVSTLKGVFDGSNWSIPTSNLRSEVNSALLWIDLTEALVHGATLTSARVRVTPGTARATAGNRTGARLVIRGIDGATADLNAAYVRSDSTANGQFITVAPDSAHVVDKTLYSYELLVIAGNDAGTNKDEVTGAVRCLCAAPAVTELSYP